MRRAGGKGVTKPDTPAPCRGRDWIGGKAMNVVTSGITGRKGYMVCMSAVVESKDKPDPEEVAAKAGYHPAGYGCYDATVTREPDLVDGWLVKWLRSASCD